MPRIILLSVLLLQTNLAEARPRARPSSRARALKLLKRARAAMKQGRCDEAVGLLEEGYALHKTYVFPLLMGVCAKRSDQPREAARFFKEALAMAGRHMPARHRRLARQGIEWAQMRLRFDKVSVRTLPERGVRLTLDGTPVGTSPLDAPLVVNVGRHELEAIGPNGIAKTISLVARGGGSFSVTIDLTHPPEATRPRPARPQEARPRPRLAPKQATGTRPALPGSKGGPAALSTKKKSRLWPALKWTALGAALAGVGLAAPGIAFLVLHSQDAGSHQDGLFLRQRYDTKTEGLAMTIAGGLLVAAACVTWGVVTYLEHREAERPTKARLGLHPTGLVLSIDW